MSKKTETRNYSFSDSDLKQNADTLAGSMARDATAFVSRGVTSVEIHNLVLQSNDFGDLPTDEELQADVSDVVETKDALAGGLRIKIRPVRNMAEVQWGSHKAKYRKYSFEGMDEMSDGELVRLGKRVFRVGTLQLADLTSRGLSTLILDAINSDAIALDGAIDIVDDAMKTRDLATEERVVAGNALYAKVSEYASVGKSIWADTDEAKFNDYVIYDTAPAPTPTGPVTPP